MLHDLFEQAPYHRHCCVAVGVGRKKHVILQRGLEPRGFTVRHKTVVDKDGGGHCLDFGGGGFGGGVRERQPLVITVLFFLDVLVFENAEVGGADERVDHELDQVLHLQCQRHAAHDGLLLCQKLGAFDDLLVLGVGEVVAPLGGLEATTDFRELGQVLQFVIRNCVLHDFSQNDHEMFDGGGAEVALFEALDEAADLRVGDGVDFLLAEKRHEVVLEAGEVGAVDGVGGGACGRAEESVTDGSKRLVFVAGLGLVGVDQDVFVELDCEGFGGFEGLGFGGLDLVLAVVVQADPVITGGGGFVKGEFGRITRDGRHRRGDGVEAILGSIRQWRYRGGGGGWFGHQFGAVVEPDTFILTFILFVKRLA